VLVGGRVIDEVRRVLADELLEPGHVEDVPDDRHDAARRLLPLQLEIEKIQAALRAIRTPPAPRAPA
jgi:hypothetical protein